MVSLNVNPSQQGLNVTILSDKATAQPGQAVTYTVLTKDLAGLPGSGGRVAGPDR